MVVDELAHVDDFIMVRLISVCIAWFLFSSAAVFAAEDRLRIFYCYEQEVLGKILQEFGVASQLIVEAEFKSQVDLKPALISIEDSTKYPDAIIMPADHVGIHAYVNYSDIEPSLFKTKLGERVLLSALSDGKLYGVPLIQGNHLMLFYNKRLVKEPAKDWQTIILQKVALDAKGISTIAWNYKEPYYFLPFLGAFGGWPLQQGKVVLNTPEMVAALDFYHQLKKVRREDCDSGCARRLFKENKLAYMISGVWDGIHFYQALGDDVGLTAIPMAEDKKMVSPFSTHLIAFPNNNLHGSKRDQLIRLVDYLQSPEVQRKLWEQAGAIPVESSAFDYAQTHAQGYLRQALLLMADTKAVPADQSMSLLWDAISKGMARRREGVGDSEAAALYMQQLGERHIRNANR